MNFYISKIKLWFRNGSEPRTISFSKNKVNVITGASATGKSSILKIIDYCLLQERCNIVEDVINSSVSWYGILFFKDENPYTVIRKAPTKEITEMITIFRDKEYFPDSEPQAKDSDNRSSVLPKLNKIFSIPDNIKFDDKIALNFRHFLLFNYLTEDIIATEYTYQDTRFFRDKNLGKILDDLFKITIGSDEANIRVLNDKLEKAKKNTNNKRKDQDKEREKVEKYKKLRLEVMQEMVNLDLCDNYNPNGTPEEWTLILNHVIENYKIQFKDVRVDNERKKLNEEIESIQEKLSDYSSLERNYKKFFNRLSRQKDNLEPINFIEKHMSDICYCYDTRLLLNKLKEAWIALRDSYTPKEELPDNLQARKKELCRDLESKMKKLNDLNPMNLKNQTMTWIRKVILLAEKIDKELKIEPSVNIKNEDIICLEDIETVINEKLLRLKTRNGDALHNFNDHINKYFKIQNGMSESYMDCRPEYDLGHHELLLKREENAYAIANVGSKSNYMFMHLCYFFGLHDLLRNNKNEQVLPFIFIDQPSIPYYGDQKNTKDIIGVEDESKLLAAFKLTDRFMKEMTNGNNIFQIIMVEHASPRYWQGNNKLDTFTTIAEFSNENGLIPTNAIKK